MKNLTIAMTKVVLAYVMIVALGGALAGIGSVLWGIWKAESARASAPVKVHRAHARAECLTVHPQ